MNSPGAFPFRSAVALRAFGTRGDFDGDRRADFVVAQPENLVNGARRYRVEVFLSEQGGSTFDVESGPAGGLHITARDVDGDCDLDLVITSELGRQPVGVWINDGHGQFTQDVATAYAKSIWQEADRDLEKPACPNRPASVSCVSGGGSGLELIRSSTPLLYKEKSPLSVAANGRARTQLNPGSPFRAPPLS